MKGGTRRVTVQSGPDSMATKALVLRVPPAVHEALISRAGAEQQRQNKKVSMNALAIQYLAEALDVDLEVARR